uniref:RNase H type-1 domain-containing protein n=1 Tax=Quercus lobata TaxID=97700 RepID=A0A7N2R3J5_QUELO
MLKLIIESDAWSVVKSIIDKETHGSLGHLYSSISQVLESFSRWEIKHVKRGYNRVAQELAQLVSRNEASQRWIGVSLPMFQNLISTNCS